MLRQEIQSLFPNLDERFEITSDPDDSYNCVAWSLNDTQRWWWPFRAGNPYVFWPTGVPCEETVEAFVKLYEHLLFSRCDTSEKVAGWDLVAIYGMGDLPTHVARLWHEDQGWTSKLGDENDILHHSLESLEGVQYGRVVRILRRKRSGS